MWNPFGFFDDAYDSFNFAKKAKEAQKEAEEYQKEQQKKYEEWAEELAKIETDVNKSIIEGKMKQSEAAANQAASQQAQQFQNTLSSFYSKSFIDNLKQQIPHIKPGQLLDIDDINNYANSKPLTQKVQAPKEPEAPKLEEVNLDTGRKLKR